MGDGGVAGGGLRPTLLATKFLPPKVRDSYVRRERLHDSLARASSTQLTLVSAPAGSGKTALVAAWLTTLSDDRWAWVSLDGRDNDPTRFWAYLIEALQRLADDVGERALNELIRSAGQGSVDQWLGLLVNDLAAADRPTSYLIVDDLQVITDPGIRAGLAVFVDSLPHWLRLIILTRADPPFPLPRLRAQGRLTEIRQSDLRFNIDEADRLLRAEHTNGLADDQMQWLIDRTAGWAAGLQLATIVLGDNPTPDRLAQVAGSNRVFADFIVSEVVDVVPADMCHFLFTTAVLDRVSPSLAAAVSGFDDAGRMLRDAQRRDLFLVALDDEGEWFRYSALFAEAIQSEARLRDPALVRQANESAARWFEERDDLLTALEHWFAADRPDEALRIALSATYQLIDTGQVKSIERIVGLIPASVVGQDAHRQLDYAMMMNPFDADMCLSWTNEAGRTIATMTAPSDELVRRYQNVRAICSLLFGEWDSAAIQANASMDPRGIGEGESPIFQRAGLQLMRAKAWLEEPEVCEQIFRAYMGSPRTSPTVRRFLAPCTWALAAALGGRIREAVMWSSRAQVEAHEVAVPPAAFHELTLAGAIVASELGDTAAVRRAIDELRGIGVTFHGHRTMADVALAMSLIADDRLADAAGVLSDLERAWPHAALGPRIYDAIDRAWVELHLCSAEIGDASHAAQRMRVGFWREATIAKVLLAQGAPEQAASILGVLSPTSPRQHVTALLLHAGALKDHDPHESRAKAEAALTMASTDGMLRTVVTGAQGFAEVLEPAGWVAPNEWMNDVRRMLAVGRRGPTIGRVPKLYEQPTERERAALRYLASRLTVAEIASEMGVSTNTMKTHLKSLYRKLEVSSRDEAVATARLLGLLG